MEVSNTLQKCLMEDAKWTAIAKLEQELADLQVENRRLLKETFNGPASSTVKYVNLQEKLDESLRIEATLQSALHQQNSGRENNPKQIIEEAENRMRAQGYDEKLAKIRDEMEKLKGQHQVAMEDLHNQLEITRAALALALDEEDTSLCAQFMNVNAQIRKHQGLKEHLQTKIDEITKKLSPPVEEEETTNPPSDLNFFQLEKIDDLFVEDTVDIIQRPLPPPPPPPQRNTDMLQYQSPPIIPKYDYDGYNNKKSDEPSVRPAAKRPKKADDNRQNKDKIPPKKRTLFNPNNLDYLDKLFDFTN